MSSCSGFSVAGSAPARRTFASTSASCAVKRPLIWPSSEMTPRMTGALDTRPSSTIASWRPTLAPVAVLNLAAPVGLSVKLTAGWLVSSTLTRAFLRSRPVMTDSRLTR